MEGSLYFGNLVLGDVGGGVAAAQVAVGVHWSPAEAIDGLLVDDEVHGDDLGLAGHDGNLDDLAADPDLDGSALGVSELVQEARFEGLVGGVVGVHVRVLGPAAVVGLGLVVVGLVVASTHQGKHRLKHLFELVDFAVQRGAALLPLGRGGEEAAVAVADVFVVAHGIHDGGRHVALSTTRLE